jgi:hypothetical protein
VHLDGLSNGSLGDIDGVDNKSFTVTFNVGVAVHATAGWAQRVEPLLKVMLPSPAWNSVVRLVGNGMSDLSTWAGAWPGYRVSRSDRSSTSCSPSVFGFPVARAISFNDFSFLCAAEARESAYPPC